LFVGPLNMGGYGWAFDVTLLPWVAPAHPGSCEGPPVLAVELVGRWGTNVTEEALESDPVEETAMAVVAVSPVMAAILGTCKPGDHLQPMPVVGPAAPMRHYARRNHTVHLVWASELMGCPSGVDVTAPRTAS